MLQALTNFCKINMESYGIQRFNFWCKLKRMIMSYMYKAI